ncbi:phage virion morphogenesis protein [Microbulbifer sp. ANSA003]|uniref:phage virion morphogenesis protein n=1 Tax=Microbulbifer sp. ANSA003 TaxID=3243360 RepID=UPI004043192B
MAGARIELDAREATNTLSKLVGDLENPAPLLRDIGEYLLQVHRNRFRTQTSPDGIPWAALSPSYLKRKSKNQGKVLTLSGVLRNTLRYQVQGTELLFGTDRPYGAVHQFGATQGQFGKTKRGSPIPWGHIPARPWLGTSAEDDREILALTRDYLEFAAGA